MKQFFILSIINFLFFSTSYGGGGWPQPKGKGYFKLSEYWLIANQHYTDQGLIDPNLTIGFFSTSFYGEYGVTDRFTAQIYAPLFVRNYHNNQVSKATGETFLQGEALNGIGDFDVTLKYGLTNRRSNIAASASLTVGLPFGKTTGSALGNLQLGDGEFNTMVRFDAGTGWKAGRIPMYGNIYAGFNKRTKGFSDEIRGGVEVGAKFFDRLWAIGRLNILESRKNGLPSGFNNGASLFANNTELTSLEIELSYEIGDDWGVSVSNGTALRGELIFANPSFSVGVFMSI